MAEWLRATSYTANCTVWVPAPAVWNTHVFVYMSPKIPTGGRNRREWTTTWLYPFSLWSARVSFSKLKITTLTMTKSVNAWGVHTCAHDPYTEMGRATAWRPAGCLSLFVSFSWKKYANFFEKCVNWAAMEKYDREWKEGECKGSRRSSSVHVSVLWHCGLLWEKCPMA